MQIIIMLAVLAALLSAEGAPREPVGGDLLRSLLAFGAMVFLALFARFSAAATSVALRRDFDRRHDVLRRFRWLRSAHVVLWLVVAGLILFGLKWAQIVRADWQLGHFFLVDDLLIVAPVILPLLVAWAVFYDVEVTVQWSIAARQGVRFTPPGRGEYVALHARHYFGLLMVPLLVVLTIHDALELFLPDVASNASWLVYVPALALVLVLFPWLLRHLWKTEPLAAGPLRCRLETINRQLGVRPREILVWHSGGMIANAAIAGMLPALRYVFLSDRLLARMSDDEIAAVYSHELGHVRHWHLPLRLLALLAPFVVWLMLGALLSLEPQLVNSTAALIAVGLVALVAVAWLSRTLERQADLCGCAASAEAGAAPSGITPEGIEHFVGALERLAALNGHSPRALTLLHPSIAQRVAFLRRMAASPKKIRAFHLRMRAVAWLLVAIAVIGLGAPLVVGLLGSVLFATG